MKSILRTLVSVLFAVTLLVLTYFYVYAVRYVQDSQITATTGVIWKTTLNLKEYRNISSGNGMLGNFDRYSRSLNHSDVITVYCNDYCKK